MGEKKLTMDDILFRCGKIMFQIRLFLEMGKNGDFFMFLLQRIPKTLQKVCHIRLMRHKNAIHKEVHLHNTCIVRFESYLNTDMIKLTLTLYF